jgi:hypothetical protein
MAKKKIKTRRRSNARTKLKVLLTEAKLNMVETHRVDSLVEDFIAKGMLWSIENDLNFPKEMGLLDQVRKAVLFAREITLVEAKNKLIREPKYIFMTKRFYKDLQQVLHLIKRNETLDEFGVWFFTERRLLKGGEPHEAVRMMKARLKNTADEIENYLNSFQMRRVEVLRNRDPLSDQFIVELFEVWGRFRRYDNRSALRPEDRHPFIRFLAAPWRDGGFPMTNHRGISREPLESWFADRVRKHWYGRKLPDNDFNT